MVRHKLKLQLEARQTSNFASRCVDNAGTPTKECIGRRFESVEKSP